MSAHDDLAVGDRTVPLEVAEAWADCMVAMSGAVADDLVSQPEAWDRLAAAVGPEGPISRVRLPDIVARNLGR